MVETIACCIWRLKYVIHEELYSTEIDNLANNPLGEFQQWDREEAIRTGQDPEPLPGPQALAGNQRMALLVRYEANLYRQYYRARRELESLQATRLARPVCDPASTVPGPAAAISEIPPREVPTNGPLSDGDALVPSATETSRRDAGIFPFAQTFSAKQSQSGRAPSLLTSSAQGFRDRLPYSCGIVVNP